MIENILMLHYIKYLSEVLSEVFKPLTKKQDDSLKEENKLLHS